MATSVLPVFDLNAQAEEVRAALERVTPPPGVRLQEVRLDNDHTGDPAIYIVYRVSKRIPLTHNRISGLTDFRQQAMAAVDLVSTGRFPYVRFVE